MIVLEEDRFITCLIIYCGGHSCKRSKALRICFKVFLWLLFWFTNSIYEFHVNKTSGQLHLTEFQSNFQRDIKINLKFLKANMKPFTILS